MKALSVIRNPIIYLFCLLALTACGGGGGGSSGGGTASTPVVPGSPASQAATIPAITVAVAPENEGTKDPFFSAGGGFDVNSRGASDPDEMNIILTSTGLTSPKGLSFAHRRLEGPTDGDSSININVPPRDVRTEWNRGWTGQGVNILVADDFGVDREQPTETGRGTHGYTVVLSAGAVAPGADFFGINAGLSSSDTTFGQGGIRTEVNSIAPANTKYHVLNLSFGLDPESSASVAQTLVPRYIQNNTLYFSNSMSSTDLSTNIADAVITKAAGNERADSGFLAGNLALATHANTEDRVLIVGALNDWAQNNPTQLARYSNFAGATEVIQNRFLVEYGGSPYLTDSFLCDSRGALNTCSNAQVLGDPNDDGTSFSAPRVAGFAALVRGKFPSLSGVQTVKILLDTATYQGLTCAPNCPIATYGQGRVDIENALSPVGKLR